MADKTGIEWTDATWNPVTGCTKVSTGCDHCYAETVARGRLKALYSARPPVVSANGHALNPFAVRLWPERLMAPLKWRRPRLVFVNSMSDLFHAEIPETFIRRIFETMLQADQHRYQILTKRPGRAFRFWKRNHDLFDGDEIPLHIWIGTSIENQRAITRLRQLDRLPATVRFLSCEPLLGPLSLDLKRTHWVIAGGESGPKCRPMDPAWVRQIRDQCIASGVPFFFKQWGGRTPKSNGRLLDGREWNELPAITRLGNAWHSGCSIPVIKVSGV